MLQLQIASHDSYTAPPTALDQLHHARVPVIRVYAALRVPGPRPLAVPTLIHVHNCYPYLYLSVPPTQDCSVLEKSINAAIAASYKRPADLDDEDDPDTFVALVRLVRGVPVYGYSVGYSKLAKVSLLSPLYKSRLVSLIGNGTFPYQAFEAHIPFISQFLADYNLYSCAWIYLSRCHFRTPVDANDPQSKLYLETLVNNNVLNPKRYPRMGRSVLEIDALAEDILNRRSLVQRYIYDSIEKPASTDIYLSSLKFTYLELEFQCSLRDADTSVLNKLYLDLYPAIGEGGYRSWESMPHYNALLGYAAKLNRECNLSVAEYDERTVKPMLNEHLPTCFEDIDLTHGRDYYGKPKLNFRDDLVKLGLFEPAHDAQTVTPLQSPESPPYQAKQGPETPRVEVSSPIEPQSLPLYEKAPSLNVTNSDTLELFQPVLPASNSTVSLDNDLFRLTRQKRSFSQIDSSGGSFPSQSLYWIRNPVSLWELPVPLELRRHNFVNTMRSEGLMDIDYDDPHYSRKEDMHAKALVFANRQITVPYSGDEALEPFGMPVPFEKRTHGAFVGRPQLWQYARAPPSTKWMSDWLRSNAKQRKSFRSQIEPPVSGSKEFKYSYNSNRISRKLTDFFNLTHLHMELHLNTTSKKKPNPAEDEVTAIFYHFNDANFMHEKATDTSGALIVTVQKVRLDRRVTVFTSENDMVEHFLEIVDRFDPDILSGYEVNAESWGYLVERYRLKYDRNLLARLSRAFYKNTGKFGDRWGYTHTSALRIDGRHMLNVWRVLKSELSLTSYTLENVCFHLLHKTLPRFSNETLTRWFKNSLSTLAMFCSYYTHRIELILKILDVQDLILKTIEQSRLIGVDFHENFYRGSQFKVESILLRIAKEENIVLNLPTKTNVHEMRPLECIPLVMEPESNFYKSPLAVLDFQSLYPSIVIAYNFCYTTLLGRLESFKQTKNSVGYLDHLELPPGIIDTLSRHGGINISANGIMFVSQKYRKSLLARMLQELLNMRINIKTVAGMFKEDRELNKLYNSKQLALKLIANVTYGYTSASYSGRMPNSDIADAIVATGREILTKSMALIEDSEFGAKVVYGDTDSLFVYFPGKSKADAFKGAKELAKRVSTAFPDPITLKFEKIYHPSVLLAKKRYVGNCFENEDQAHGTFEAKGIETVRRDGVPAQLKMVGKALRILFATKDLSLVKQYVVDQFQKMAFNKVNVKDFCFAKAVRYGTYKHEQYLPPGAIVARERVQKDPRSEPQYRERVPYIVIRDPTKERVKDRSISPEDYVLSFGTAKPHEIDFEYYITRVLIPPLERVFNLIGVDVRDWYKSMPRINYSAFKKSVFKSFFGRDRRCFNCDTMNDSESAFCSECLRDVSLLVSNLTMTSRRREQKVASLRAVCSTCSLEYGYSLLIPFGEMCSNEDCQYYYDKLKAEKEHAVLSVEVDSLIDSLRKV